MGFILKNIEVFFEIFTDGCRLATWTVISGRVVCARGGLCESLWIHVCLTIRVRYLYVYAHRVVVVVVLIFILVLLCFCFCFCSFFYCFVFIYVPRLCCVYVCGSAWVHIPYPTVRVCVRWFLLFLFVVVVFVVVVFRCCCLVLVCFWFVFSLLLVYFCFDCSFD